MRVPAVSLLRSSTAGYWSCDPFRDREDLRKCRLRLGRGLSDSERASVFPMPEASKHGSRRLRSAATTPPDLESPIQSIPQGSQPRRFRVDARRSLCLHADMSSYLGLHYHLVFSTRDREPWITTALRPKLHEYLGGIVRGLGGEPHGVGGTTDHVHLLVSLKSTHCLADFMRELKKASSVWMHDVGGWRGFAWQEGYCALTVSPSGRDGVRAYIARQEEHHRTKTFREELEEFLAKAEISHDERHLK